MNRPEATTQRALKTKDIAECVKLVYSCSHIMLSPGIFYSYCLQPNREALVVASTSGAIVGLVCARLESGQDAHIDIVCIDEKYRKRGLASCLVQTVVDRYFSNAHTISLEVRASNLPARACYEKLGFEASGPAPHRYYSGADSIYMIKTHPIKTQQTLLFAQNHTQASQAPPALIPG